MKYDVIIIGAGASGLTAAISAARQGSRVLVLEQKEKAGKKILATGNGKCNYTNLFQAPECYRSGDSTFAWKVLSSFDVNRTIEFFEELGIYPRERDGYLYPNSEQALSVLQVLLFECERLNVTISCNERVTGIKKPDFTVYTEQTIFADPDLKKKNNKNPKSLIAASVKKNTYEGKKLILAAGGCASPKLGSDGSGYSLAEGFGHRIIKPLPALVQLKSPEKFCKTLSGVRTASKITLFQDSKLLAKEAGEILFTDYGISGIPILQVSRYASIALDKGERLHLCLDFLPELEFDKVLKLIKERIQRNSNRTLEQMLVGLFQYKLSYIMILSAGLDPYKKAEIVKPQEIEALVKQIKEFTMRIHATNSFENAQVCAGGIATAEINAATMESKRCKNLYLSGEIIDVDGTCGGYNLQWAWSSGYLAGLSAGQK